MTNICALNTADILYRHLLSIVVKLHTKHFMILMAPIFI